MRDRQIPSLLLCTLLLAGCGQTGPLYLPEPEPAPAPAPTPAPASEQEPDAKPAPDT